MDQVSREGQLSKWDRLHRFVIASYVLTRDAQTMKDFHRFAIVCMFVLIYQTVSDVQPMKHFHRFYIVIESARNQRSKRIHQSYIVTLNPHFSWFCVVERCNIDETC